MVERLRELVRDKPRTADLTATAAVLALVVASSTSISAGVDERSIDVIAMALLVGASLMVYFRRTQPVRALVAASAMSFAYWIADYPNAGGTAAMLVLLYSVAVYAEDRQRSTTALVGFTIALLLVLTAGYFSESEEEVTIGLIVFNLVLFELAWLTGDAVRNRRERIEALELRMASIEQEQQAHTDRAVNEERDRIARELHDILAHSMSVVVVQAEGAQRLVGRDDAAVVEALNAIGATSRNALGDIRGLVGLVRAADGRSPAPQLSMLPELIDKCSDAGLSVALQVNGERRLLPPMIELSGYRIVQESLTNAIKHAGPNAHAQVTVDYGPDRLDIHVTDTGRGAAAERSQAGGHGLAGMRERVEAFGGEFRSGPHRGGGYRVDATLPVASP